MALEEIAPLLEELGCPADKCLEMARQLDKRARQLSERKGKTYEEALAHLLSLMRQGWAAMQARWRRGRRRRRYNSNSCSEKVLFCSSRRNRSQTTSPIFSPTSMTVRSFLRPASKPRKSGLGQCSR